MQRNWLTLLATLTAIALCACESEDDAEDGRRHVPPAGLGSVLVENQVGGAKINVVINGELGGRISVNEFRIYDREPGTCTIHLDFHESSRNLNALAPVEEGRNTIVNVDDHDSFDDDNDAIRNARVEVFILDPR